MICVLQSNLNDGIEEWRQIRAEQDAEYEQSLFADERKELQRLEEIEQAKVLSKHISNLVSAAF